MIPIEHQVTSLQVSQELKKFGVPQGDSYFVWFEPYENSPTVDVYPRDNAIEKKFLILCDAFTLSELISMTRWVSIYYRRILFEPEAAEIVQGISKIDNYAEKFRFLIRFNQVNAQDLKL